MLIKELFKLDVTRDIPPVVYFHEQDAQKLADEVGEYIVTGGYPEGDPRAQRVKNGIHEQYVRLLTAICNELAKKGGPELPASWISGFYGSGKSSFAKLLGLALDGKVLPDGTTLAAALLARDESPRAPELRAAWDALRARVDPLAVVFDIGGVARDNEHIHSAVVRQIRKRLGYCGTSNAVAEYELKLEIDGEWDKFLKVAEQTLGKPWARACLEQRADDHFSSVLHVLYPKQFPDPTSWVDSRSGSLSTEGSSASEAVQAIDAMLKLRAKGKTLFVVVDEVSQYVHQDQNRMLKLQSFVSELGQRLRGGVWLLVTGQEKLEDASEATTLGKLKERFPQSLRVHLAVTNIRDVVHRRLLRKDGRHEAALRDLFQRHRTDLKLNGYRCEEITEEDFVEVYPMLPGHVDLLLRITTALRSRSTRMQGDDHAIRGLLQLLGELFRAQKLAEREVGELVTIDAIYEVQHTSLDSDVQQTLARIFAEPAVIGDALLGRVAKAVALLELIQEEDPTTAELVARTLYAKLGAGSSVDAVTSALDRLKALNLLGYSEKHGYKIQSSAGQEWQRERGDLHASLDEVSSLVQEKLRILLADPERPRLKGQPFPWTAFYSDSRQAQDVRLQDARAEASMRVDFRFVKPEDRRGIDWVKRSSESALEDRLLWVVGEHGDVDELAKELKKSQKMCERYGPRQASLSPAKQSLYIQEKARVDDLASRLSGEISQAFLGGSMYFRGRQLSPRDHGSTFGKALQAVSNDLLPELYPQFTELAITSGELNQLLEPVLNGPSTKFLESGLGILSLDAGRYIATCEGQVPAAILRFVEDEKGASGSAILARFQRPPYGWPADVVNACLAGLLRASKIRIKPKSGPDITSVKDPGTKNLFGGAHELRGAEVLPGGNAEISGKDRVAICQFFKKYLGKDVERENDAIGDAVFQQFPAKRDQLRDVEARFERLPGRPPLPDAVEKLSSALERCMGSRQIEVIVVAVKKHLDQLRDGFEQLNILSSDLTDEGIALVRDADTVRTHQLFQLEQIGRATEVGPEGELLQKHLADPKPWRDAASLAPALEKLRAAYVAQRQRILGEHVAQVEAAKTEIRNRDGFARLSEEQQHAIIRPLTDALFDTTSDALAPTLLSLRDTFRGRLETGRETAGDLLDAELSRGGGDQIQKFQAHIHGRELRSTEQLDALLDEMDSRLRPLLERGVRVRIVG